MASRYCRESGFLGFSAVPGEGFFHVAELENRTAVQVSLPQSELEPSDSRTGNKSAWLSPTGLVEYGRRSSTHTKAGHWIALRETSRMGDPQRNGHWRRSERIRGSGSIAQGTADQIVTPTRCFGPAAEWP